MISQYWTPPDLKRLKAVLASAKAAKKEIFKFEGNDVYVPHAEQLVKVLEARFRNQKE